MDSVLSVFGAYVIIGIIIGFVASVLWLWLRILLGMYQ